jgi:phosphoglycerol transferase
MMSSALRWPGAGYVAAAFLSSLATIVILGVWNADLTIPFSYGGDALSIAAEIKGMSEGGWFNHNPSIGLPTGSDLCDFPIADSFHYVILKLLVTVLPNYAAALNVFFLLSFPLTTFTTLLVLRHFKVPFAPALVASLLYPFLHFHFRRSLDHLFLGTYYALPLIMMVALWILHERPPFFDTEHAGLRPRLGLPRRKTLVALAISVAISTFGVYYAFFSAFLIVVAGASGAAFYRSARNLVSAGVLLGALIAGLGVSLAPSIIQRLKHGPNQEVAIRMIADSEYYALRVAPMLLPISEHRIPALGRLRDKYNNAIGDVRETDLCALGLVGSAGFLYLLWRLLSRRKQRGDEDEFEDTIGHLSILNGAAVLLGTVGAFGVLFAILVSRQIRAYNRISVFIAFFSFFAIAMLLARLWKRIATTRRRTAMGAVGLAAVALLGLWDQSSPAFRPQFHVINAEYKRDAAYFRKVEASVPAGTWVAQLPYTGYPEGGHVHRMRDYDHFKAYLHSTSLRWSYGAVAGRTGNRWQFETFSKPTAVMLRLVVLAGFGGLYIDRFGFPDSGSALITELRTILGVAPLDSDDGRRAFFSLSGFADRLRAQMPANEWDHLREASQKPLDVTFSGGCVGVEGNYQNNWRWCGHEGRLTVVNAGQRARTVVMKMVVRTGHAEEADFAVEGALLTASLKVSNRGALFERPIVVPPGRHTFKLNSNARRTEDSPRFARELVFRLENLWVVDVVPSMQGTP